MATTAKVLELDEDTLLRNYLRVLTRRGTDAAKLTSPGHDLRTCTRCGTRTAFTLDPEGTWFRCTHCGTYA